MAYRTSYQRQLPIQYTLESLLVLVLGLGLGQDLALALAMDPPNITKMIVCIRYLLYSLGTLSEAMTF